MRKLIAKAEAPPKKKKADEPPPPKITHGQVWVSERFVGWQEAVLHALQVRRQLYILCLLFCYSTITWQYHACQRASESWAGKKACCTAGEQACVGNAVHVCYLRLAVAS
jgi:hypothetical protein